jgi:glycosyltransferase involved in cell wall biosynthesis
MTTIAAVIPLHNKAPFVERAIRSALRQKDGVDEIVVIDDASDDDGMAVVERIAGNNPTHRFTMLHRDTPGPGGYAARNAGIQATQADWIAFLDADDAWSDNYIRTARRIIAQAPDDAGVVFMSRRFMRPNGASFIQTSTNTPQVKPEPIDFDGFLRLWRALRRCPMWTCATIIRREPLLRAGQFPAGRCKRGGDKDTWLRVMRHCRAIASPFVGAIYHNDAPEQVTRTVSVNQRHCLCDTLIPMIEASTGERQRLLKWIFNSEMQKYARWMFGQQQLRRDVYRGFYVEENPALYFTLRAMSLTPLPVQRMLRRLKSRGAFTDEAPQPD